MKLYYHKTDGGAEYLTDKYIDCPNGHKEGIFEGANYIVRIDGDIENDAEITIRNTQQERAKDVEILACALNAMIRIVRQSPLNADRMRAIRKAERALEVLL